MAHGKPWEMRVNPHARVAAGMAIALALGLLLSSLAALHQQRANEADIRRELESAARGLERDLLDRLRLYEYRLLSVRGVLQMLGEDGISRQQFARYSQSRNIDQEFPGARGFGFIRRVPRVAEADFLQRARADGNPDFAIRQLAPHDGERYVIQYIEPVARNSEAIGLDVASESNRREAANSAMLSGRATLTGPITLVQVTGEQLRAFLFLLPIYRAPEAPAGDGARVDATLGWAYAPLAMKEVLAGLDVGKRGLHLVLRDISAASAQPPFYETLMDGAGGPRLFSYTLDREVYGRQWRIELSAHPEFIHRLRQLQPGAVFSGGLFTSLLASALAGALLLGRERKRQILSGQARLATIVEDSSDAIIGEDMDGRIITWNRAAERLFGYGEAEALGQPLVSLLVPADRQAEDRDLLNRVASGEQSISLDTQRRRRDGALIDVSITCSPMRDERGRVIGTSKLLHDIGDRKRAESYLREFNARLEREVAERTDELTRVASLLGSVLDASSEVAIIATEVSGLITVFNRGAEQLLGYRAAEMVGRCTPEHFHLAAEVATRAAELSAECGRPVAGFEVLHLKADIGGAETRQWTYLRQDGSQVQVSLVVTAIRTPEGQLVGYLGMAQDITERLRIDADLKAAKAAAEAANAAKSLFLANMSHEIRTPMNAVIGIAHLLQNTPLDERQQQLLAKLQIAGRSLLGIINDLLDIAKIEAGEMRLESATFSPGQLLRELGELFAPQAEAKGLAFSIAGADVLPECVQGDALRLSQILSNLIGNALKFTEAGSVQVAAEPGGEAPGRLWVRFAVKDTGCGIPANALGTLFNPFTQADASTTRRFGGTGLGLSIVQHLTRMMDGRLGVSSQPGQGSEFWVSIPFATASCEPGALGSNAGLEILVVDDSEDDRQQLLGMCRALGWRATGLASGEELLSLLRARSAGGARLPDALAVDWHLPAMDGLQALQQAAAELGAGRLPASLIVSARERDAIAALDHSGLVEQILVKPVNGSDLFNAVNAGVARQSGSTDRVMQSTRVDIASAQWLCGLNLLLVDDSEINLEVAQQLLEQQGARVVTRRNGAEALAALRAEPDAYDAVLMDIQMPEMDGYEATRRLRGELGLANLPVLALTAGALPEERRQAEAAGMNDFLSKPLDPADLIRALRRAVECARGAPLPTALGRASRAALDWPEIPGIDAAEVAHRTGGDAGLFLFSLRRLLQEFQDFASPRLLHAALESDRACLAARVHKLRGASGLLGARDVCRLAGEAEALLRGEATGSRCRQLLAELGAAFSLLRSGASPLLEVQAYSPVRTELAPADAAAALQALAELLRKHDIAAIDQFHLAAPGIEAVAGAALVQQAWQAIEGLDYARAIGLLERAGLIPHGSTE